MFDLLCEGRGKLGKNFAGDQHRADSNFVPKLLLSFMQLTQFNLTNFAYLSIFACLPLFISQTNFVYLILFVYLAMFIRSS